MKALTVREMRQGYQALQKVLEEEGEVVLTHHGKPFARVMPLEGKRTIPSNAAFRATLPPQKIPSEVLLEEDRNAH